MKWAVLLLGLCVSGVGYAGEYTLYFVRHFEKQATSQDPELTTQGHQQAEQLADLLDNVGLTHIYSTDYRRTQQSAASVAKKLGMDVQSYDPRELSVFTGIGIS